MRCAPRAPNGPNHLGLCVVQDGFLLVMICGLFVVIAGARLTGVPDYLYGHFEDLSPLITGPKFETFVDLLA